LSDRDEKEALLDIRDYFRRRGRLLAAIPISAQSPRSIGRAWFLKSPFGARPTC
jgi:hypothetical protein